MNRPSVRMAEVFRFFVGCVAVAVFATTAVADTPSKEDVTGTWTYTSYLIDPTSKPNTSKPPEVTANVWAIGELKLTETPTAGEKDTIKGTLAIKGLPKPLEVRGRRVTEDGVEELVFRGEGALTVGGQELKLIYTIRGGVVQAAWPKGSSELSLRGYVRSLEFDPIMPKGIGAFVAVPAKSGDGGAP